MRGIEPKEQVAREGESVWTVSQVAGFQDHRALGHGVRNSANSIQTRESARYTKSFQNTIGKIAQKPSLVANSPSDRIRVGIEFRVTGPWETRQMMRRKFAVIKFWPNVKAAEDEIIERLKIAARSLGLECIVVDTFARLVDPPHTQLTRDDVDFVLSMHFTTPKRFDIFSLVTLWNPLPFYH